VQSPSQTTTTKIPTQPAPTLSNIIAEPTRPAAATAGSRQEQIQRAIAAAEMPPTTSAQQATMTPASQTAVVTPLVQKSSTTNTSSLMRALSQAEGATTSNQADSTPKATQEPYQWPDIKPPGTQQTQYPIQRTEDDYPIDPIDPEPEESTPPINIDQLANTVYSQLRKRLAVEWERGRGKR
jgi:hypothetical protein